jgi:cysteine desulfurase
MNTEENAMIYLDNNATTPLDPAVREAMLPWLTGQYGNPSAGYRLGRDARLAVDKARQQLAALLGAHEDEIIFTSCGTESTHTAITSAIETFPDRRHLVTTTVEHSATFEQMQRLEKRGYEVTWVSVGADGLVDLDRWRDAIREGETALASMIWANNETGVIAPVVPAAEIAHKKGVLFHSDAVQAAGKMPINLGDESPLAMLSLSGHKLHAPKGVGVLWASRHVRFSPVLIGGGQESGRRSGTENVASIVAFGKAAEVAAEALSNHVLDRITELRDAFEAELLLKLQGIEVNGDIDRRLANTSNLYFPGIDAEGLLILLDKAGVCCSPGSACSTGEVKPSRILTAMGHTAERARSSVRFSMSRLSTREEVGKGAELVVEAAKKLDTGLGAPKRSGGPVIFHN